ncbi:MAG: hypothetical protein M1815_000998 [Lichina confinis]|nr:MAG: hypothetical protein M1815_000998 [Lichina confinis]
MRSDAQLSVLVAAHSPEATICCQSDDMAGSDCNVHDISAAVNIDKRNLGIVLRAPTNVWKGLDPALLTRPPAPHV